MKKILFNNLLGSSQSCLSRIFVATFLYLPFQCTRYIQVSEIFLRITICSSSLCLYQLHPKSQFDNNLKLQINHSLHSCTQSSSHHRLYIGRHSWLNAFENFRKLFPYFLLCRLALGTCNKGRESIPGDTLAMFPPVTGQQRCVADLFISQLLK
jgi:hypothetical protein